MTSVADPAPTLLRLGRPADLVAAVPVVLGFRPRESLVLVATGGPSGRRVGLTLRVDLPPPPQVRDVVAHAAEALGSDSPVGAAVIVVGARARERTDVVDAAVDALHEREVAVHTAVWAEHTGGGARWGCYGACGCTGVLPEPGGTELDAAAVLAGAVVRADREELEQLVVPVDPVRIRRRERLLVAATDPGDPDAGVHDGTDAEHRAVLDAALADAAAGRCVIDDRRALALTAALTRPTVRDAVLVRCAEASGPGGGPGLPGAETLWAALCRELPDPEAAEPAALLAAVALLRGDGALANVALDRAERSWPGHRLTRLLRSVAAVPLRPAQIRECLLGGGAGER
ncbi:DUF4192 domain-containing protein [Pseudonocardia sp. KRD-184]|uniref:DUF4192 domain-containing protein n=2 Tax=Pseudonocardia oceani TaxID=2792013 RepID=A0ABS6UEX1_9PSEU|nr:DUF4192 domain-containing protein [Pseudonocardia oceani]MBW0094168.1 DUF4192 domain-containing protein [Pseudonocardia oceani]MBW0099556.1 DUF4192 domain-containing protein [Pseudonocardia oceani]MBW0112865.1 DUF4192 domain-containing protein [Pseudonocardia oceani]MBW0123673.1 DUF4192 domain-containing protein [Pseudonocardia oceani]MBW0130790.1 DUF4192 domain-containing protein [Pseudonocardia oceani]